MTHTHRSTLAGRILLLGFAVALMGCKSAPMDQPSERPVSALHVRSLALDSMAMQELTAQQEPFAELPWYVDRNDRRLAANAGVRTSITEIVYTRSVDRQIHAGTGRNRVQDFSTTTTYRTRTVGGAQ